MLHSYPALMNPIVVALRDWNLAEVEYTDSVRETVQREEEDPMVVGDQVVVVEEEVHSSWRP